MTEKKNSIKAGAEVQCGYNQKCNIGLRMSLCELEIKHIKEDLEQLGKYVICSKRPCREEAGGIISRTSGTARRSNKGKNSTMLQLIM